LQEFFESIFGADAKRVTATTTPGDEVGRELAEIYERASGKPHPNWDEYYQAMVTDKRLVLRFTATSAAGMTR